MNDNLKNLNITPDPEIWDGIEHSLRRKAIIKRGAIVAASVVAVAVFSTMLWPTSEQPVISSGNTQEVAAMDVNEESPMAVCEEVTTAMAITKTDNANTIIAEVSESDFSNLEPTGTPYVDRYVTPKAENTSVVSNTKKVEAVVAETPRPAQETMVSDSQPVKSVKASSASEGTEIYIPNAFAPDGDEDANRVFRVFPSEVISNFKMYVYDRAGHNVFESSSVADGWDGTYKGQKLPQSAYVYVITFTKGNGTPDRKQGTVVLIR